MAKNNLYGDWTKAIRILARIEPLMKTNIALATKTIAQQARDNIVETIANQVPDWPELKEATVARKLRKGGSGQVKMLIDNADLMNNIVADSISEFEYFVGILRNVKNKDGTELVNIGLVHEYGSRDGTIPQRSFIEFTFNKNKYKYIVIWEAALKATLNGKRLSARELRAAA